MFLEFCYQICQVAALFHVDAVLGNTHVAHRKIAISEAQNNLSPNQNNIPHLSRSI